MIKTLAIVLAAAMLAVVAWGLFFLESSPVTIVVNGQQLSGPLTGAAGAIVAAVALFCAAILLAFVLAGVGLFVLGCAVLAGLVLAGLAFPLLLPLLIPLAIVWGFVAVARRTKSP